MSAEPSAPAQSSYARRAGEALALFREARIPAIVHVGIHRKASAEAGTNDALYMALVRAAIEQHKVRR